VFIIMALFLGTRPSSSGSPSSPSSAASEDDEEMEAVGGLLRVQAWTYQQGS
jgi:hypothetical protein